MKPVDDIYIYIYIFQHGRLVYTEGHAGGAALGAGGPAGPPGPPRPPHAPALLRPLRHGARAPARDIRVSPSYPSRSCRPGLPDGAPVLRPPRHGARARKRSEILDARARERDRDTRVRHIRVAHTLGCGQPIIYEPLLSESLVSESHARAVVISEARMW